MAWLKVYYTLKTAMLIDSADCYGYSSGPTMEIKVWEFYGQGKVTVIRQCQVYTLCVFNQNVLFDGGQITKNDFPTTVKPG